MSKGIVLIAYNTSRVNYYGLAMQAAKRIKQWLNLPIALITNASFHQQFKGPFDEVVVQAYQHEPNQRRYADYDGEMYDFKNRNRNRAFDLSPFDQTILLDVDYMVNSKHLHLAFEQDYPYLIQTTTKDIAGGPISDSYIHIAGIPVHWATCVYFDKSDESQRLFDLVDHVQDNWKFYSSRYKFPANLFRNDYAFSVAHHILSGRQTNPREFAVDFRLAGINDEVLDVREESILFYRKETNTAFRSKGFDVHVLHKASLIKCLIP